MRRLVGALGRYKKNLAACWGFDCLYGINDKDAVFWYNWWKGRRPPTLHLLRQQHGPRVGEALPDEGGHRDQHGGKKQSGGPADSIDVEIGTGRYIDDVMELEKLLDATTPKPGQPQSQGSDFLDRVLENVRRNAGWPATDAASWEMHYAIARDGLLRQLKAARYLGTVTAGQ